MPNTAVHSKALTALSVITPGKPARAKFNSAQSAPNTQEGNLLPPAQKEALAEHKALQDPAVQKRDLAHCHIPRRLREHQRELHACDQRHCMGMA